MKTFLLVIKILIPVTFAIITGVTLGKMNGISAIGGIMTIAVIGAYVFEYISKEK